MITFELVRPLCMRPLSTSISSTPISSRASLTLAITRSVFTPPEVSSLARAFGILGTVGSTDADGMSSISPILLPPSCRTRDVSVASSRLPAPLWSCCTRAATRKLVASPSSCRSKPAKCFSPSSCPQPEQRAWASLRASKAGSCSPRSACARETISRTAAWLSGSLRLRKLERASSASARASSGRPSSSSAWASQKSPWARASRCLASSSRQIDTASPAASSDASLASSCPGASGPPSLARMRLASAAWSSTLTSMALSPRLEQMPCAMSAAFAAAPNCLRAICTRPSIDIARASPASSLIVQLRTCARLARDPACS
mmetsp:Transcript_485/g.1455  ORF Transcript_485/g.1455 Transcript_485/m.1455 type:complete len:318 (-) Transcript_485:1452-2405(-)